MTSSEPFLDEDDLVRCFFFPVTCTDLVDAFEQMLLLLALFLMEGKNGTGPRPATLPLPVWISDGTGVLLEDGGAADLAHPVKGGAD
jgi:hypothetical protein